MRISDTELAAVIRWEIQQAQGYDADVLATKRANALNYYQGKMKAAAEGRSQIVSKDVADSLHSLMSQLAPILKTTMIEFKPNGEEDEAQAQCESDFVRDAIDSSQGWRTIFAGVHDALLIANGWLKVTTKDETKVTTETYPPGLTDEAYYILSQPTARNQTVQIRVSSQKTTVKRTTTTTKLSFKCIPPENMLFSEGAGLEDLNELRFVAEREAYTESQLVELGVSETIVKELPDMAQSSWPAVLARSGPYQYQTDQDAAQDSQKLKEVFCCYIMLSSPDGLKSERRYVWISGTHILKNEAADSVPYITGSAVPMPHRVQGMGLYELLESIQSGKTHILRNYLDNLSVANAGRIGAVEGRVNMDDLLNGRVNGVVRMKSPDALVPLPASDIGPQSMQGLEYLDHIRTQRVGSSVDINEVQAQVMKSSATAAAGQLAMVEQMAGWFAENLVETMLKPAFARVHMLLRTDLAGPTQAKIRGKWQQTDTGQWPERENMQITMGMTTAEKAALVGTLTQVIQKQTEIMMQGGNGILVNLGKVYNSMTDWLRASNIQTPEQYLIDPDSPEAQQAMQQQAMSQAQQQKQMQQMQQQLLDMQHAFELEKQRRDLEYKTWSDRLDAEVKEAQMTGSNIIEMKKLQQQRDSEARGHDDAGTDRSKS